MDNKKYSLILLIMPVFWFACGVEKWKDFQDESGLFRFSMPERMIDYKKDSIFLNEFEMKLDGYLSMTDDKSTDFMLVIQKIDTVKDKKGLLDSISPAILSSQMIEPICESTSLYNGESTLIGKGDFQQGEIHGSSKIFLQKGDDFKWAAERCFISHGRIILMKVLGANDKKTSQAANRFFSSFTVNSSPKK